jgi:hypothetical protein
MTDQPCVACGTFDEHSRLSPWCITCAELPREERTALWMEHVWCPEQTKPVEEDLAA